jgi:hypothetical protein
LLGVRPRTSSPLKLSGSASATTVSTTKAWKRRPSVVASSIQARNSLYPDEVTIGHISFTFGVLLPHLYSYSLF